MGSPNSDSVMDPVAYVLEGTGVHIEEVSEESVLKMLEGALTHMKPQLKFLDLQTVSRFVRPQDIINFPEEDGWDSRTRCLLLTPLRIKGDRLLISRKGEFAVLEMEKISSHSEYAVKPKSNQEVASALRISGIGTLAGLSAGFMRGEIPKREERLRNMTDASERLQWIALRAAHIPSGT